MTGRFWRRLIGGLKRKPAPRSPAERYAGFTRPNIPKHDEWEPTYTREGGHVVIGRPGSGTGLSPTFRSSHDARPHVWTP